MIARFPARKVENKAELMTDRNPKIPNQEAVEDQTRSSRASKSQDPDAVWTYRGYQLRASEFTTSMVHFFRAEITRANFWRQRLDTTTNWAVVTSGAVISITFTQSVANHYVVLLNALLVTMFLIIEARRYRYYELWSYRVRLMETDFFAAMLVPPFHPSPDWAESLSENLLHPHFPISFWEAIGRRLRRNYLWIYLIIGIAWIAKLWLQPQEMFTWGGFINRAAIGPIPGEWVILAALVCAVLLIFIALATVGLQETAGEVLPRFGRLADVLTSREIPTGEADMGQRRSSVRAWFRPTHRRPQLLTLIITDRSNAVSQRILEDMHRGVTALPGLGMYSKKEHSVLLCALTNTEVQSLRSLVEKEDPEAFVVVTPAQEVFGKGFLPLEEES